MLRGPLKLRLEDFPGAEALAARIRTEGIVLAGRGEEADLLARPVRKPSPPAPGIPGAGRPGAGLPKIPARELQILAYLAEGRSNAEIASALGIGVRTIRFHLANLYGTLGVSRRGEAVREALRKGLISLDF